MLKLTNIHLSIFLFILVYSSLYIFVHSCIFMFRSRETENFEYLKNVILHFMISDSTSREQLIKPIATVLHFTPNEVSESICRLVK